MENKRTVGINLEEKKTQQAEWELSIPQGGSLLPPGGEDESPTLKKLKDLNKKYYSDKLEKKK